MRIISVFFLVFILSSCVKNNPLPVWLDIDGWSLQANPALNTDEGELSHNLTDAWVYVNDKLIGVFELPCKIPVLVSGSLNVTLYPTIRNNGISATKKIYPFCDEYKLTTSKEAGETIKISPITQYKSDVNFYWKEEFENVGFSIDTDQGVSNAEISRSTDQSIVKYGTGCGYIHLNSTSDSLWQGYTNSQLVLPKSGAEVYLEVDYYTTNSIVTGVLAINSSSTTDNVNIQINGSTDSEVKWKKIYIDLKEIVSASTTAEYFEIYFRTLIDTGDVSGDIYIDNIKVIFF